MNNNCSFQAYALYHIVHMSCLTGGDLHVDGGTEKVSCRADRGFV